MSYVVELIRFVLGGTYDCAYRRHQLPASLDVALLNSFCDRQPLSLQLIEYLLIGDWLLLFLDEVSVDGKLGARRLILQQLPLSLVERTLGQNDIDLHGFLRCKSVN